jgi:hypothetical protein
VLRPALDLGANLDRPQALLDLGDDLAEVAVALRLALDDHRFDLVVALGVQGRERQVLELPLEVLHAQPVRERGVDRERLLGDALLAAAGHVVDRPHVVQPVRELDDQHPEVGRHRHQHLAQRLGLLLLLARDLQPVELGHPVDEHRALVAEVPRELGDRHLGVLHGVVEERRADRGRVHAELREDLGDPDRMDDVRLAGLALLARVRRLGDLVRPQDRLDVDLRRVAPQRRDQRLEAVGDVQAEIEHREPLEDRLDARLPRPWRRCGARRSAVRVGVGYRGIQDGIPGATVFRVRVDLPVVRDRPPPYPEAPVRLAPVQTRQYCKRLKKLYPSS